MVRALHSAEIEVILDVVYNHTAEGNHLGPALCFKGIDNASYYRLDEEDPSKYVDYTGTGNSLNVGHPAVIQLIMDSLRYWVQDMHVDGFRFDLAATLARELEDVDMLSTFFQVVHQDPVVSQVKLIAEPWDVGEGGYQVGRFPPLWMEWNGKYRDSVRDLWRGTGARLEEVARRISGSPDLYESTGRKPIASVNFVTAHDGFTLKDLVSYERKHNEANPRGAEGGADDNRSWNCGAEGESDDPGLNALRARQCRNLMATLLLSQGIPMISGGDEIGRTQRGNNNAYCQDNEMTWHDWQAADRDFLGFTTRLVRLRRGNAVFRRPRWPGPETMAFYRPDGTRCEGDPELRSANGLLFSVLFKADQRDGGMGPDFLLMANCGGEQALIRVPSDTEGEWRVILDTAKDQAIGAADGEAFSAGKQVTLESHALILCRLLDRSR
jgi:glycogen operon protein